MSPHGAIAGPHKSDVLPDRKLVNGSSARNGQASLAQLSYITPETRISEQRFQHVDAVGDIHI